jgi:cell division septal protein FtsQ
LDLCRIKRDLELVPAVQSAAVERVLPHTLRVRVLEREPVAQVMTTVLRAGAGAQNAVFLLDAEGNVMLPLMSSQRAVPLTVAESYPVVVGASPGQFRPGRRVDSPQVRAALRLLAAFEHSPMAGLVELSRIDVSAPQVLVLTTDQQSEVAVRSDDLERQLNRWRLIYDVGASQGRQIGSLDLSVMENIPLRWQESAAAPPGPAKPRKTSPYKKKHV